MSKRINVYIRDKTYQLLKDYMEIEEFDMSRAVDEILTFRLKYLEEERAKAEKKIKKNQNVNEWFEKYWDEITDESKNNN